mmetsp:Transcript_31711/g.101092  ORF Transcript_31711/g.101092 Transcript_31711/m.101092 type:complete len:211 (+) Transcript_31711:762-1394(+)
MERVLARGAGAGVGAGVGAGKGEGTGAGMGKRAGEGDGAGAGDRACEGTGAGMGERAGEAAATRTKTPMLNMKMLERHTRLASQSKIGLLLTTMLSMSLMRTREKTPVWVSHATRTCRKAAPFTDVMSTMENNQMALSKRARSTPAPNETVCTSIAAARAPHTLPCTIDDKTCQQSSRYPVRRAALFPPRSRGRTWGWEGGGVAVGRGRV